MTFSDDKLKTARPQRLARLAAASVESARMPLLKALVAAAACCALVLVCYLGYKTFVSPARAVGCDAAQVAQHQIQQAKNLAQGVITQRTSGQRTQTAASDAGQAAQSAQAGQTTQASAKGSGQSHQAGSLNEEAISRVQALPSSVQLAAACRLQNPVLPTGCESVALTNALLYQGFSLSTAEIATNWMPYSETDFVTSFMGDPTTETGNSCMAPCIANTANAYLQAQGSSLAAHDITGANLSDLLTLVSQGTPVVVWCTIDMEEAQDPYDVAQYEGRTYTLYANSHSVTLTGYDLDQGVVYVSDPLVGVATYDLAAFATAYVQLGQQAVYVA